MSLRTIKNWKVSLRYTKSPTRKSYTYKDKLSNNLIAFIDKKLSKELTYSYMRKNKIKSKDIPAINKEAFRFLQECLDNINKSVNEFNKKNHNDKDLKLYVKTTFEFYLKYIFHPIVDILKTSKSKEETASRMEQLKHDIKDIKYIILKETENKLNNI